MISKKRDLNGYGTMSRSYKHTPINSWAGCHSALAWRTQENRKYRAYSKNEMRHDRWEIQDYCGKFGNEWDSPRDGKMWWNDGKGQDCVQTVYCHNYKYGIKIHGCDIKNNDHYRCNIAYMKQMRK